MARRVESDEFSGPRSYIDVKIKWVSQLKDKSRSQDWISISSITSQTALALCQE